MQAPEDGQFAVRPQPWLPRAANASSHVGVPLAVAGRVTVRT
jgi:hypothetical protein